MTFLKRRVRIRDLMEISEVRFGTSGARGLVADMTDEICFAYVSAFLQSTSQNAKRVALAIDLRPSSPGIAAACTAAIEQAGFMVDYCGAIPTPALAFHAQLHGMPAVMVTGSHIPFERNGIKFYAATREIDKGDELAISEAVVDIPASGLSHSLPVINTLAYREFIDRYLHFFSVPMS